MLATGLKNDEAYRNGRSLILGLSKTEEISPFAYKVFLNKKYSKMEEEKLREGCAYLIIKKRWYVTTTPSITFSDSWFSVKFIAKCRVNLLRSTRLPQCPPGLLHKRKQTPHTPVR